MNSTFENITTPPLFAESAQSFFNTVMQKVEHFPIKMSFIFGVSIILGSVVPYIPQYLTIQQTQNTEGFSLYVCLTLLVANILRILFWFPKKYEIPLLIQSIVMIAAMFALLELCVRVRNNVLQISRRKHYFTENGDANSGRSSALDMNVDDEKVHVKFSESSKNSIALPSPTILSNSETTNHDISPETILNVPSLPLTPLDAAGTNCKNYSTIPPADELDVIPARTFKNNQNQCEKISENTDCYTKTTEDTPRSDVALLEEELNNNMNKIVIDDEAKIAINTDPNELIDISVDPQKTVKICKIPADWPEKRHFMDFNWRYFWEWTDFISYIECMVAFTFIAGSILFMFGHFQFVVEAFGYAALVTESLLASPQFYRNFKAKSTEGMSRIMVATWFIGDLYKTIYFIARDTPVQFWVCGMIQITFDISIFFQLFLYRKSNYKKLSKTVKSETESKSSITIQDREQMLVSGSVHHRQVKSDRDFEDIPNNTLSISPTDSGIDDSFKMHKIH